MLRQAMSGGSQASSAVEATMGPSAYARLDAMFTNVLPQQGGGPRKKSQAKAPKSLTSKSSTAKKASSTANKVPGSKSPVSKSAVSKSAVSKSAVSKSTVTKSGNKTGSKKIMAGGSLASNAVLGHVAPAAYSSMETMMQGGGRSRKWEQRGGSLASSAVMANVPSAGFIEIDRNFAGVLPSPPASTAWQPMLSPMSGGGAKTKNTKAATKAKSLTPKNKSDPKKKLDPKKKPAPKKKLDPKKKRDPKKKVVQRGGADDAPDASCNQAKPDNTDIMFSVDNRYVPVANPVESDTRFSTCDFKDVLSAPGAILGPRFDYTVLPEFNGSPFTLGIPGSTYADFLSGFAQGYDSPLVN